MSKSIPNRQLKEPLILAVETSGRLGSVAIALGERILAETPFSGPMKHSSEIFPAVHNMLESFGREPQQIEHVYISIGPGSFTGLRIATTLAKTMHLANNAKIIAVDTLDVIAANTADMALSPLSQTTSHEKIAVILDAKRSQFFISVYQYNTSRGIGKKLFPDSLMTASQFLDKFAGSTQPLWLLGEGLVYYKDKFKAEGIRFLDERHWTPRATMVHLLGRQMALKGQFADPLTLTPTYLRCPV